MQIDGVIDPRVSSWQYHRRAVAYQSKVADEARVQYRVQVNAIGAGAFGETRQHATGGVGEPHIRQDAADTSQ